LGTVGLTFLKDLYVNNKH